MEFGLKDIIYIVGIVASVLVSHFSTRQGIKEYVRDKNDDIKKEIESLKVRLEEHRSKDDMQEQVINQLRDQMNGLINRFVDKLEDKNRDHD